MTRVDNLVFTFCFELWYGCDDRISALAYFLGRADRYDLAHCQTVWIQLREETQAAIASIQAMRTEALLLMVEHFPLQLQVAMA